MTPRGRAARSRPLRYARICFSSPGTFPSPSAAACAGVTMNPAPCNTTPRLQSLSFARKGTAEPRSAPTVRSARIRPRVSSSSTSGASLSRPVSRRTLRKAPSRAPAMPTVMAMRTAALSLALSHGWSGTASTSDSGLRSLRCFSTTRRENAWVIELVVINPKRRALPSRTVSAALSQKCMTKSAPPGICGRAFQQASA